MLDAATDDHHGLLAENRTPEKLALMPCQAQTVSGVCRFSTLASPVIGQSPRKPLATIFLHQAYCNLEKERRC